MKGAGAKIIGVRWEGEEAKAGDHLVGVGSQVTAQYMLGGVVEAMLRAGVQKAHAEVRAAGGLPYTLSALAKLKGAHLWKAVGAERYAVGMSKQIALAVTQPSMDGRRRESAAAHGVLAAG